MLRSTAMTNLIRPMGRLSRFRVPAMSRSHTTIADNHLPTQLDENLSKDWSNYQNQKLYTEKKNVRVRKLQKVQDVSEKDKISVLLRTLYGLEDSKEAVYGALDAWVASEMKFPIGRLKTALAILEKKQQWHKVVQVIKWMLSKGQGVTVGTYGQLIHALDMDHRVVEANIIWVKKLCRDLHSMPWKICNIMISVYYRNDMMEELVKLFKRLEAYGRKPHDQSIVQKVADSYEKLGLLEEREHVLEKYKSLYTGKRSKDGRKLDKKVSDTKSSLNTDEVTPTC